MATPDTSAQRGTRPADDEDTIMTPTQNILNAVRLPARLASEQAAVVLGFQPDHMTILVREGLLKPLGRPAPNSPKHFATRDIMEKAEDVKFLSDATRILSAHWAKKNRGANKPEESNPTLN